MIKLVRILLRAAMFLLGFVIVFLLGLTLYVYITTDAQSFTAEDELEHRDYVMILGCGIYDDEPTPMLEKRLEAGIKTYKKVGAKYIILSGYFEDIYYDEVEVMKNYIVQSGISQKNIIEDKYGSDTFQSIKNAIKNGYGDSLYIVTQDSHLRRALFLANALNPKTKAYGIKAGAIKYQSAMMHMNFREIFARVKALFDIMRIDIRPYLSRLNM